MFVLPDCFMYEIVGRIILKNNDEEVKKMRKLVDTSLATCGKNEGTNKTPFFTKATTVKDSCRIDRQVNNLLISLPTDSWINSSYLNPSRTGIPAPPRNSTLTAADNLNGVIPPDDIPPPPEQPALPNPPSLPPTM